MVFYGIIIDDFMVYYSKNANFVIIEMVYDFLLLAYISNSPYILYWYSTVFLEIQ